jgi:hypothetical protein
MPCRLVHFITLALLMVTGSAVHAGVDPVAVCQEKKLKAAGKRSADLLKAVGRNKKTPDLGRLAADTAKARSKFTKAFTRAERGSCQTTNDASVIGAKVDAFVSEVEAVMAQMTTTSTTVPSGTTTTTTVPWCDGGALPTCDACPLGQGCGRIEANDCGCVPTGTVPCGNAATPECDGTCPAGLACSEPSPGAGCSCGVPAGSCTGAGAPPACGGSCPTSAPYCIDSGGSCVCSATLPCSAPPPSCEPDAGCTIPGLTCGLSGSQCECLASCGIYPNCATSCPLTVGQVCSIDIVSARCVCLTASVGCNGDLDTNSCGMGACPTGLACYFSPMTGRCGCRYI